MRMVSDEEGYIIGYEGPNFQLPRSRSKVAALCYASLFLSFVLLMLSDLHGLFLVASVLVFLGVLSFWIWAEMGGYPAKIPPQVGMPGRCSHDWHKAESILEPECPFCGGN
jgi:hypothetical protein